MSALEDPEIPKPLRADSVTADIIREQIWRPVNRKDDWRVFAIVGREGSGKSLTCASILKAVDPTFSVERIHFEPVPFLEDIGEQSNETGLASMSDESGVAFGNRTWHDREQVEANQYLQTARDDNRVIGMTAPRLEELDIQLQGRLHHLIETERKKDGDWVEVRWKRLDPSRSGQNKIYQHYPRRRINNRTQKVTRIKIGLPPEELIEPYQKKKAKWKGELQERVVGRYEDAEPEEQLSEREIVEEILDDDRIEEYIGNNNGQRYVDRDLIAVDYGIGRSTSKRVKKALLREVDDDEIM